ncbi:MAG: 4-hydroxyphenylpyruvate [Beijerinckiaceae bacterium]|nr:MAG: 4-hydroxyphenylpyruvate [Beijerinckiaceae bacterium]
MRRSIATVSLSGTLPEKLEAIAVARFDGVEIFENDLVFCPLSPRDIRAMADDLGLTIDLFQPFRDLEGVDEAQFLKNLDRAQRKFDVMGELAAPMMLVCSNVLPDAIDDDARSADQLHRMAVLAQGRGIKLAFEALAWGTHVNTFGRAFKIVKAADHAHLGLALDSFHTLALPNDWSALSKLPGDRIFFMQIADAPKLDMASLMLSRHHRCLPGQGELDVAGFVDAALQAGYTGTMSLEIFNDGFRAAPPRQTARDGMRSLLYVEEQVRRRQDAAIRAGEKREARRVSLFDPPAPAETKGIAFIEFAVDEASHRGLARLLASLGFARLGRHRSKDVELYGAGDIRFVLNAERDSIAHSFFLLHGPSVCALAFEVDDPLLALGRAEAYGCQRLEGRLGPNEVPIPGTRALDGTLIYFNERGTEGTLTFEADFVLEKSPKAAKFPEIARIDHVAQALPEGTLDASVLFCRAVLDLAPEPTVILADPYGLVRSRAISDKNRRVRFPLNIAQGRNTGTARSIGTYSGAGVHHIALETQDIFATARALRGAGAPVLAIPQNYYDDLGARYGLDEARLAELASLNLLYEQAGEAEFLHLYTLPFEDRFFFEFVQRNNGYDLYGASNAGVRMAALAQSRRSSDLGL